MAEVKPILVGDEVTLRKIPDKPVAVVTYNTAELFCAITKHGITYRCSREAAYPLKTGRHFAVEDFLKTLSI